MVLMRCSTATRTAIFFFQAEDGIRDVAVTGVQTCALPIYPTKQAALLPALWLVQEARGWISDRNMAEVAEVLGLTPAYVKGVVTFYTMYHQHPVGKHFVQVCTTSPCNVCGAEAVVKALLDATGAKELGATSPDGKWTVIEVECLGACGFATPVLVDDDFVESVSAEKVPDLVKRYK